MKVALFVAGSPSPPTARQMDPLLRLWNEHLVGLAGCERFAAIYPISKQSVEQLQPGSLRASGNGEALDEVIARKLKLAPFDAAVVAWDILPPLRPTPPLDPEGCRWLETQWIMGRMAASTALPRKWREVAAGRQADYASRRTASTRASLRPLLTHEIRLLCMEPEFEDLLLAEREIRAVLGVAKKRVAGWPKSWTSTSERRGKVILHEAIEAARKLEPADFPAIPGTMARTAPNEWAEWLVRALSADDGARERMAGHALLQRLGELMPPAAGIE